MITIYHFYDIWVGAGRYRLHGLKFLTRIVTAVEIEQSLVKLRTEESVALDFVRLSAKKMTRLYNGGEAMYARAELS